jgi:putative nucleotidyltransferase with HDIG domain
MTESRVLRDPSGVGVLVSLLASAATASIVATSASAVHQGMERPLELAAFVILTLALQLTAVDVYDRGQISVAGLGLLAVGFEFGIGAAMTTALLAALVLGAKVRMRPHRTLFNAATFALAAGAGSATYELLGGNSLPTLVRVVPALAASAAFWAVNIGLLSFVMSLDEGIGALGIWRERFRWLTGHYLAFGPLALGSTVSYVHVGLPGLIAFVLPPALLILSTRQYLQRTRQAVEEVRAANDDLLCANAQLEASNADLQEMFQFAGGLAARAHDRAALVAYAEETIERLTGGEAHVADAAGNGIDLVAGGKHVGGLELRRTSAFDGERWERLRDAILPQLATAIESADLVAEVRQTHLATIAALSRSMEAKDYYTGGHTERVSSVAVAIAERLGFAGSDLDAIQVGALLHDIGKIGIPEQILRKEGPLDEDEWTVMKEHPIISDYILSDIDVDPIVRQIARSSHERIDGQGYPDGLAGDEIPLAARIVLVADALDALTSDRPYRDGRSIPAALEELRAHGGTQFCPTVLAALARVYEEAPELLGVPRLRAVKAA